MLFPMKKFFFAILLSFFVPILCSCSTEDSGTSAQQPQPDVRIEDIPIDRSSSSSASSSSSTPFGSIFNPEISYGEFIDARDSRKYKFVQIEDQTWMAQNLNYSDSVATKSLLGSTWCAGDTTIENYCDIFGRLYTWAAALDSINLLERDCMDIRMEKQENSTFRYCISMETPKVVRGICPDGWRIPSLDDFDKLYDNFGGKTTAGHFLKSTTKLWNTNTGNDLVGFSAIPTGYLFHEGYIKDVRESASFHTANHSSCGQSHVQIIYGNQANISIESRLREEGYAVRCIKITEEDLLPDEENQPLDEENPS